MSNELLNSPLWKEYLNELQSDRVGVLCVPNADNTNAVSASRFTYGDVASVVASYTRTATKQTMLLGGPTGNSVCAASILKLRDGRFAYGRIFICFYRNDSRSMQHYQARVAETLEDLVRYGISFDEYRLLENAAVDSAEFNDLLTRPAKDAFSGMGEPDGRYTLQSRPQPRIESLDSKAPTNRFTRQCITELYKTVSRSEQRRYGLYSGLLYDGRFFALHLDTSVDNCPRSFVSYRYPHIADKLRELEETPCT